jgi:hypothetical protein
MNNIDGRLIDVLERVKDLKCSEYKSEISSLSNYQTEFLKYLYDHKIDAILSPSFGCPAILHGFSKYLWHC